MKQWLMMAIMLAIVTTSIPIFAKGQMSSHKEKGTASSQAYDSQQAQNSGCK